MTNEEIARALSMRIEQVATLRELLTADQIRAMEAQARAALNGAAREAEQAQLSRLNAALDRVETKFRIAEFAAAVRRKQNEWRLDQGATCLWSGPNDPERWAMPQRIDLYSKKMQVGLPNPPSLDALFDSLPASLEIRHADRVVGHTRDHELSTMEGGMVTAKYDLTDEGMKAIKDAGWAFTWAVPVLVGQTIEHVDLSIESSSNASAHSDKLKIHRAFGRIK